MSPGGGGHPGSVNYPYDSTNTVPAAGRIAGTAGPLSPLEGKR
jgi:hypothetical protein